MTPFEFLKQASRTVAGMIAERTPPAFETCKEACRALGELVQYTSKAFVEDVSGNPKFVAAVTDVIAKLAPLAANPGGDPGEVPKDGVKFDDFAAWYKDQVEKSVDEGAAGLRRLHALKVTVDKAVGSYEDTNSATVRTFFYVDPWQQASVMREGNGAAKVTSGTANQAEVKATPGISIDDVMKAVGEVVTKASSDLKSFGTGWANDLASSEFLEGRFRHGVSFGRDGK